MTNQPRLFDHALLDQRRDRAARMTAAIDHNPATFLLDQVIEDLTLRLDVIQRQFATAACIGAHDGSLGRRLRASGRHNLVVDCDSAARMLALCGNPKVRATNDILPFKTASIDLAISALALQFVDDLPGTLVQIRHALRPDGLLLASIVGGDSLFELREAFLAAEAECEGGASPRVAPFADVQSLGGLLQRAGFALPVVDVDRVAVTYADPIRLMHDLRAMGVTNPLHDRSRKFLRRATLQRMMQIYAERFARPDGRMSATFDIVTLTAWAPHESQQKPLRPGSATTRLADALATRETKL